MLADSFLMTGMESWTHFQVFMACMVAASFGAIGAMRQAGTPMTFGNVLTAVMYRGGAGCAFALVGYSWLGGRRRHWQVIGAAFLVGLDIIKISQVATLAAKILRLGKNDPPQKS